MPSHRRRITPQPTRRPQVAGLRKPGAKPTPRPRPTPYSAQDEALHADERPATDQTQAPEAPEAPAADVADVEAAPEAPEAPAEPVTEAPETEPAETETPAEPRPTPRTKARDTGTLKPTSDEEIPAGEAEPLSPYADRTPAAQAGRRRDTTPFVIAVALAAIFAIGAALLGWQYFSAKGVTDNKAWSDPIGTAQVKEEVKNAVQTLFSYDYSKLKGREKKVEAVLASDELRKQFKTLNCAVNEQAPKQQIVTATRVVYSAVTELTDDTAKVIVFVENIWERKSSKQRSGGAGALGVNAKLVDGQWKLDKINIHGGETGKKPEVPDNCK